MGAVGKGIFGTGAVAEGAGFTSAGVFAAAGNSVPGRTVAGGKVVVGAFCGATTGRRNLDRQRKLDARRWDGNFSSGSRWSGCEALDRFFRSSGRDGSSRSGLLLQLGDFAPELVGLAGLLLTRDVKLFAQSPVFSQQVKGEEGSNDQKNCKEDSNQLNYGHWASLEVLDLCAGLCSMLERQRARILRFVWRLDLGVTVTRITSLKQGS